MQESAVVVEMSSPQRRSAWRELVAALAESRAVAFVGAGVSVGAGLPTWKTLIEAGLAKLILADEGGDEAKRLLRDRSVKSYRGPGISRLSEPLNEFRRTLKSETLRNRFELYVEKVRLELRASG